MKMLKRLAIILVLIVTSVAVAATINGVTNATGRYYATSGSGFGSDPSLSSTEEWIRVFGGFSADPSIQLRDNGGDSMTVVVAGVAAFDFTLGDIIPSTVFPLHGTVTTHGTDEYRWTFGSTEVRVRRDSDNSPGVGLNTISTHNNLTDHYSRVVLVTNGNTSQVADIVVKIFTSDANPTVTRFTP